MPDGAAIDEPLKIIAPDWSRRSVRIDHTPFLIGRGSGNQLQLSDGRISRSAAAIVIEDLTISKTVASNTNTITVPLKIAKTPTGRSPNHLFLRRHPCLWRQAGPQGQGHEAAGSRGCNNGVVGSCGLEPAASTVTIS
jgi:hypothetical protein